MRVGAKLAVTMTDQGVIRDPVIEIEGQRIKSVMANASDQQTDLYVDGVIIPGLISTHTHLHGLVAYGHPVPAPAGFWPFLKQYWWPFVEDVLSADDVASLAAYASILHLKSGFTCFLDVMESPYAEPGFILSMAQDVDPPLASIAQRVPASLPRLELRWMSRPKVVSLVSAIHLYGIFIFRFSQLCHDCIIV